MSEESILEIENQLLEMGKGWISSRSYICEPQLNKKLTF
jgi:hypothetical protein